MRDLPHIVGQVFNTPLMIHTPKLDTVLGAIGNRILTGQPLGETHRPEPRAEYGAARIRFQGGGYLCDGGIAVLPILGTLIRRGSWMDSLSGLCSYSDISGSSHEMFQHASVRGLMLDVDSFGGEAGGCFDLVSEIVEAAAMYGKPVWAIANEAAASAAYALACAADRIYVPQMGVCGSIGVVCAHIDMSQSDKLDGVKWTYVFAGDHKIDGNPHEPLPDSVKADLQDDIEQIYQKFASMVAERRGLSIEAVRETQARMFRGENAVEAGLADEVGTMAEAMNAFAEHLDGSNTSATHSMTAVDKQRKVAMAVRSSKPQASANANATQGDAPAVPTNDNSGAGDSTDDAGDEGDTDSTASAPSAAGSQTAAPVVATPAASADQLQAAAIAERNRVTEMHNIAAFADKHGIGFDLKKAVDSGMSADVARRQVMDARASADEALPTVATPNQPSGGGTPPAAASAGWSRAYERAAQRAGLPTR